jgi:hypothetical protein
MHSLLLGFPETFSRTVVMTISISVQSLATAVDAMAREARERSFMMQEEV